MKYPYEKYIGILLIEDKDNKEINRELSSQGFLELESGEFQTRSGGLQNLYNSLEKEAPESKAIAARTLFEISEGVIGSYSIKSAIRIGEIRDYRLVAQRLILEGAEPDTISEILNDLGAKVTPGIIRTYEQVLWNIKCLIPSELALFLNRLKDTGIEIPVVGEKTLTKLPKRHRDIQHKWDHGQDIKDLALEDVSNQLGRDAYLRYQKAANSEDPFDQRMAIEWAKVVIRVRRTEALVAKKATEDKTSSSYIEGYVIVPGEDTAPDIKELPMLAKLGKPIGQA